MELKEQLVNNAAFAGGCIDGISQLNNSLSKQDMLQVFWDRIDFCLAKNFPDKDFLKENFTGELEAKGIYIDRNVELPEGSSVLLGNGHASLLADGYKVCRLYAKHTTNLVISASGNAFVMVDALDSALVTINCDGDARVVVCLYASALATSYGSGQVKIIRKNRETYEL